MCNWHSPQWCLDRQSEELLGEEAARQLLETEEHCREVEQLQQQQDEYLAHILSQGFIQQQLVSTNFREIERCPVCSFVAYKLIASVNSSSLTRQHLQFDYCQASLKI